MIVVPIGSQHDGRQPPHIPGLTDGIPRIMMLKVANLVDGRIDQLDAIEGQGRRQQKGIRGKLGTVESPQQKANSKKDFVGRPIDKNQFRVSRPIGDTFHVPNGQSLQDQISSLGPQKGAHSKAKDGTVTPIGNGRMNIGFRIAMLVMKSMMIGPTNGTTLSRQSTNNSHNGRPNPTCLVRAMRKVAMINGQGANHLNPPRQIRVRQKGRMPAGSVNQIGTHEIAQKNKAARIDGIVLDLFVFVLDEDHAIGLVQGFFHYYGRRGGGRFLVLLDILFLDLLLLLLLLLLWSSFRGFLAIDAHDG